MTCVLIFLSSLCSDFSQKGCRVPSCFGIDRAKTCHISAKLKTNLTGTVGLDTTDLEEALMEKSKLWRKGNQQRGEKVN